MIDEIQHFHDKGETIFIEIFKSIGMKPERVSSFDYEFTIIELCYRYLGEVGRTLTILITKEKDIVRKKCLVFLLAKVIEETQFVPIIAEELLKDDSESPYVLFTIANALFQHTEYQIRCIEIFRKIILDKENHMDMRYYATANLHHIARKDGNIALIPILLEILVLKEYHFNDPYFAGYDMGDVFIADVSSFDPNYSEYWIIDIKHEVVSGLSYFPKQFEMIVGPLISFMIEKWQIEEYIELVASTLCSYIDIVPQASKLLMEKVGSHYDTNDGAKMIINAINESLGNID